MLWAMLACGLLAGLVPLLDSHAPVARDGAVAASPVSVLAQIAPFALVDQHGEPFGTEQLAGQVWVANFVFTRCPTFCPALTRRMAELLHDTAATPQLQMVSFSIDPTNDTPTVLARYANAHGAVSDRWSFVTGPIGAVRTAIEQGLRTSMGDAADEPDLGSVMHGTKFVLVDASARIRGYYDSADDAALAALARDAQRLAHEATPVDTGG